MAIFYSIAINTRNKENGDMKQFNSTLLGFTFMYF